MDVGAVVAEVSRALVIRAIISPLAVAAFAWATCSCGAASELDDEAELSVEQQVCRSGGGSWVASECGGVDDYCVNETPGCPTKSDSFTCVCAAPDACWDHLEARCRAR